MAEPWKKLKKTKMNLTLITKNPNETKQIGRAIGNLLKPGDILLLFGELGTGKTCLTQGIADGIGIDDGQYVNSPSYILINVYKARIPIYHIDLYRILDADELFDLGLDEYLFGKGICIIEWADRLTELPNNYLKIILEWLDHDIRKFMITGVGTRYENIVEELSNNIGEQQ